MEGDLSKLGDLFGDYQSMAMDQKWEHVKATLPVKREVTGYVIVRVIFGVFLDIGVGFPALIRVTDLRDADVTPFKSIEMYPAPGSTTAAVVVGFNDRNRQIDLSQRQAVTD